MTELLPKYGLYINGEWRDAKDGATLDSTNPANGEFLAKIADATEDDVNDAVKAAREAFNKFKRSTVNERSALLNKIADIIDANKEHLARVETMDNGKPIRETLNVDIPFAAQHFRYFAGVIQGEEGSSNVLNEQQLSIVLREPIGVVGQIVPWNFPFLMAAWKLAPVIAAGDASVFKPSSETSLSVLELFRLIGDILPKGLVNIVTGRGSKSGEWIKNHTGLDKLAFTGSTEIGRDIAIAAAQRIIPATLELGGKSANIFFADANLEKALDGLQLGILFNQGQVCCAGSRIFVEEKFYDKFMEAAVKKFANIKVGDPLDPNTQMGAQVNKKQAAQILEYVKIGKDEGATVAVGGEAYSANGCDKGAFVKPTLLTNVTNDMRVAQEEIFGPVGVVIKFKDEEELIKMVNDSEYGLGGGIFTQDITKALRVARLMETGRVWINTYNQIPEGSPFGGYKNSGIGRETHKIILEHYTQMKNIMIDLTGKPSGFYEQ
ncbi:aldehyde dehydrogenase family protein [Campylobacter sp. RM9344]|uniref:Aldehyde dehydrogenase family protein n=1 Tax=Campylobacter californiensis TaxID=1032243 RepID=A0AAW3ZVZ6_9BACT|nr:MULTISPECIES: aldehyde dehydrogenase family protein [unclassified Campylobacter]MBE2985516.1 aldehyde dehydrogenase family protein [Campylobacter sp. RM6883]MBE2996049.1 aldehyde dehydrogenase family protein [Campylobacter sp. RM6913]MBE3023042.1 aldehyde dehydrogenase family protein [Campylobacter sp. 7477a]MBE3030364.1 aldehyde dehydrogenase family protein [Campylobacter sp. RM9344]MBE3607061.1 aldehyde dehydrogenase family protein [Campylobacter sp. RM13119]